MAGEWEVNGGGEKEGGIEKTNTSDGSLYFPRVADMSTLGMNRSIWQAGNQFRSWPLFIAPEPWSTHVYRAFRRYSLYGPLSCNTSILEFAPRRLPQAESFFEVYFLEQHLTSGWRLNGCKATPPLNSPDAWDCPWIVLSTGFQLRPFVCVPTSISESES